MTNPQLTPTPGRAGRAPRHGTGVSTAVGLAAGAIAMELARHPITPDRLLQDGTMALVGADIIQDAKNLKEGAEAARTPKNLRGALLSLADYLALGIVAITDIAQIANGHVPMDVLVGTMPNRRLMQTRAMLTQGVDAVLDIVEEVHEHGTTTLSKVAVAAFPPLLGVIAGGAISAADIMIMGGNTVDAAFIGGTCATSIANGITTAISHTEGSTLAATDIGVSAGIVATEIVGGVFPDQPLVQAAIPFAQGALMSAQKAIHRAS